MKKFFKRVLKICGALFILLNIMTAFYAYKFTNVKNAFAETNKRKIEKTTWSKIKDVVLNSDAVKLKNSIIPDTSFQTVYLITKDNLKLEGWYIKTDSIAKGTVLLFHGHGSNKSSVINEARSFLKMGYNTFLLDFRAHGSSEGNICTIGYYESEDVTLAYNYIKDKGEKNIMLWGISMGAAAITKAINDDSLQPSKIILEMPYGTLLQATEGRTRMLGLPEEPVSALITFWGGIERGFWAFNLKPEEYARKIKCPVLLQWGKNDPRVSKNEIEMIYNNISAPKKLVVYENSQHESLCSNEPDKWEEVVKNFLQ
jgi:alpha-beta hydrolase superfamily lysophospholipase